MGAAYVIGVGGRRSNTRRPTCRLDALLRRALQLRGQTGSLHQTGDDIDARQRRGCEVGEQWWWLSWGEVAGRR